MQKEPRQKAVTFTVNGTPHTVTTWPMARLLDVLREDLRLTGTKEGCGEGECGACSVLLDGTLVNACLLPMAQVQGRSVTTIEGLAAEAPPAARAEAAGFDGPVALHAVQKAFIGFNGAQCGICTPGMVLATVELLKKHPSPSDDEIKEGLAGNLCRCTGYMKIFDAVRDAARTIQAAERGVA